MQCNDNWRMYLKNICSQSTTGVGRMSASRPPSSHSTCKLIWKWQSLMPASSGPHAPCMDGKLRLRAGKKTAQIGPGKPGFPRPPAAPLLPAPQSSALSCSASPGTSLPPRLLGAATPPPSLGCQAIQPPLSCIPALYKYAVGQRDGGALFEGKLTTMTNLVIHADHQPVIPDYAGHKLWGSEWLSLLIKGTIGQQPSPPCPLPLYSLLSPVKASGPPPSDSACSWCRDPSTLYFKGLINLVRLAGKAPPGYLLHESIRSPEYFKLTVQTIWYFKEQKLKVQYIFIPSTESIKGV